MSHAVTSTLTAQDMRRLRASTGLSRTAWSELLACQPHTIVNIENGQPVSRHIALLAILMASPAVRGNLEAIKKHAEKILEKDADIP